MVFFHFPNMMTDTEDAVTLPKAYIQENSQPTDWKILTTLRETHEQGGSTQAELVDVVGKSKSTISERLSELEDYGLVETHRQGGPAKKYVLSNPSMFD